MKTYEEIKKEISKVHEELSQNEKVKKEEINRFSDMEFKSLKERHEYMVEHKAEKEESLNRIAAMEEKSTELRLALMILKNNLKQSLFAEVPQLSSRQWKNIRKNLWAKRQRKRLKTNFLKKQIVMYIFLAQKLVSRNVGQIIRMNVNLNFIQNMLMGWKENF